MIPSLPPDDPLDKALAEALAAHPVDSQALSHAVLTRLARPVRHPFARMAAPLPLGVTGGTLLVGAAIAGYAAIPLAGGLELALLMMMTGGL